MRTGSIATLCIAALSAALAPGCASGHVQRPDRPPAALQEQRSAALSGARYAGLFRCLEDGRFDQAKDDMDLWIDMAILQLQFLEERYPNGDWAAVEMQKPSEVRMERFYKRIADFRRDHARRYRAWLGAEDLKRIEAFVEKYQ